MADRFPLIIDTTDKKLKELPVGDNLRIDGDIIIQGNITGNVVGNLTGSVNITNIQDSSIPYIILTDPPFIPADVNQLNDADNLLDPFIPTDLSELTDNQGLLNGGSGDGASTFLELTDTPAGYTSNANKFLRVTQDETGISYGELNTPDIENALGYTPYNGFSNDLDFLTLGSAIPYSNLIDTPFIPSDVSELTDDLGIIGSGNGASTFLELTDTPAGYTSNANKFLRVTQDETGISYGELNTPDIENALGYTPYNGTVNPLGFLAVESDTLNSVVQRGNNTELSISLNSAFANSLISNIATLRNELEFFDNNLTAKFDISVENNKILSLANRLDIDTAVNSVTISNCSFLGFQSSIGSTTSYWNSIYSNNLFVETITNKPNTPISITTGQPVNIFLSQTNKVKLTGTGCLQLSKLTTAQRNALTAEIGDIIYNIDLSTVQIYVAITDWAGDPPNAVPGWISLYTPPDPPTGE